MRLGRQIQASIPLAANASEAGVRHRLTPHPGTPPGVEIAIDIEVRRLDAASLNLDFHVSGDVASLVLPAPAEPARADGLWQHSCFEAFLRCGGDAYWELNFSPSRSWAAYSFDGYRSGMAEAELRTPLIEAAPAADEYRLSVSFELPASLPDGEWRLGLAAVIEEQGGRKSYWALAHAAEYPDFHDARCFTASLAPPAEA